ncbi:hypothetical protein BE17_39470 [Sorangium cellulosum]|uniref:Uncharacterized protein n=1 Tax=Sorangium cellulosum TaxID=56 RepID=A0A150SDS0_SORCE|nr:hypothetical protein BE17_39470 [Sorangium cellulosum]
MRKFRTLSADSLVSMQASSWLSEIHQPSGICHFLYVLIANNERPWGDWMPEMMCPVKELLGKRLKTAVCGLETRIEARQGDGDDTGLNDMRVACCALEFI